jgi:hypothetical protein
MSLSILIALVVTQLGTVLAIVGATGSTTVSYILPGLCYYRVMCSEPSALPDRRCRACLRGLVQIFPQPHLKRRLAYAQLVAGLGIMPLALTVIAIGSATE